MRSYADRLHERLEEIVRMTDALLNVSKIEHDPGRSERLAMQGILTILPESNWSPPSDEARLAQRGALDKWRSWEEHARLTFAGDAPEVQRQLAEAAGAVTRWLERSEVDFSVPRTITEAKAVTRKHVEPLFSILRPLRQPGRVVAVPDTNVLIRSPDLARWSTVIGSTSFMVLLVPAVLAELDALKMNHRIEAVREKARSFSNRIRGWRHQGNLGEGVRVEGDVWLKVVAREPDFKATLSWLDSDVADDRIIASILAYQWSRPSDAVVLLSGDSVMLAKADEAEVPTADTPEPDP